jgi:hypothetical protein
MMWNSSTQCLSGLSSLSKNKSGSPAPGRGIVARRTVRGITGSPVPSTGIVPRPAARANYGSPLTLAQFAASPAWTQPNPQQPGQNTLPSANTGYARWGQSTAPGGRVGSRAFSRS